MTVLKLTCCESQRSAWSCWIWDLCCPAQHVAQYCCLVALGSAPRPAEGHVQTRPLSPPALAPQPWNKEKMILSVSNSDLTTFLFLIHTYSKYFKMSCFLSQRALNFYTLPQNLQKYQYNEIWSENCLYVIKQTYKQLSMTVVNIMLRWQQIHYRFQWSCKKKNQCGIQNQKMHYKLMRSTNWIQCSTCWKLSHIWSQTVQQWSV